jgi:hypothetical protein
VQLKKQHVGHDLNLESGVDGRLTNNLNHLLRMVAIQESNEDSTVMLHQLMMGNITVGIII